MQENNARSNLFTPDPDKLKYYEINNFNIKEIRQKKFMNGLQNAQNILNSLESSLNKTRKYEQKLMRCKASHHSHSTDWCDSELSEDKSKCSKTDTAKSSRSRVDLAESWSTMSIVCLQYQYEELSKRYESLLQAYDERCSSLNARDATLARLRQRVRMTHARLAHSYKTLLTVGEKYLALRKRRIAQKCWYEEKIDSLKKTVREVMEAAEHARLELDSQITHSMTLEKDSATALLLTEIRKCNLLFLENLRLKNQIEELAPGNVIWESF